MVHEMKLQNAMFNMIKEGTKTVELRLYDEKRRALDIGDTIVFSEMSDDRKRIAVVVRALHRYRSFEELFDEIPLVQCGFPKECSKAEAIGQMKVFYSKEKEYQNGVLGIKMELSDLQAALVELGKTKEPQKTEVCPIRKMNPNKAYSFDNFIVGNDNHFAYAAILAAAEAPGNIYNPIYLYSKPGLGKTYLLHAVANYIAQNEPEKKVLFTTVEEFTKVVIDNILQGARYDLRDIIRSTDVFLIDDVHFLAGKEATQSEVDYVFRELCQADKQIIVTADRSPRELLSIDSHLCSRFSSGLVCDISSPDYEMRMAFLEKRVWTLKYDIGEEVLEYIARNITTNFRELSGAFNRLCAYAMLNMKEVDVNLAEKVLSEFITVEDNRK